MAFVDLKISPLIDSHCHIHDSDYDFLATQALAAAKAAGLVSLIAVGTNYRASFEALDLAKKEPGLVFASAAFHPHEAAIGLKELKEPWRRLKEYLKTKPKELVAIGECGLDYYYHHDRAVRLDQAHLLNWHFQLAEKLQLPLIFHVRQAFSDFWRLYEAAGCPPGVLHSFSDEKSTVERVLAEYPNLYFGLNGIMTFSKDPEQLAAARLIPSHRLLLETDAPYLTPPPYRGRPNRPEYLPLVCQFLAELRQESPQDLAKKTTANSQQLFSLY